MTARDWGMSNVLVANGHLGREASCSVNALAPVGVTHCLLAQREGTWAKLCGGVSIGQQIAQVEFKPLHKATVI